MRRAYLDDFRRRLIERRDRWSLILERFVIRDVPALGTLEMQFDAPVTVICGPNGAGKSSVLAALSNSLNVKSEGYERDGRKLSGGGAAVFLHIEGSSQENAVTFQSDRAVRIAGLDLPVHVLNTGAEIHFMQEAFAAFDNIDDLLNGAGRRELNENDLTEVNYVTQRDYRRVAVSEVEANGERPFFEVSSDSESYDSRTMGAGELSSLFIWWALQRADSKSLFLIEEPESFLSPASQTAIGGYILVTAVKKMLTVVLTSHSAAIIETFPKPCIKFVYRSTRGLSVTNDPSPLTLSRIGIITPILYVAFVEDRAGKTFSRLLLEHSDPVISASTLIEIRNGESEISTALRGIGKIDGPIKIIGMYDGDMRVRAKETDQEVSLFLPGDEPIEKSLRTLVQSSPSKVAVAHGLSNERMEEILYGLQGHEHHEWYEGICKAFGRSKEQLFSSLFQFWLRDEKNKESVFRWHRELRSKLDLD